MEHPVCVIVTSLLSAVFVLCRVEDLQEKNREVSISNHVTVYSNRMRQISERHTNFLFVEKGLSETASHANIVR